MPWTDAFAPAENLYRQKVMEETWGHLAPKKNKTYKGRIVFATGIFGNDNLNPTALLCEFKGLDSSPWFYDCMAEFLSENHGEPGGVYLFEGNFKNYVFEGEIKTITVYA